MTKLLIAIAAALPLVASANSPASQYDDFAYPSYELADLPTLQSDKPATSAAAPQQPKPADGEKTPCGKCC